MKRNVGVFLVILLSSSTLLSWGQSREQCETWFSSAASEFGVPPEVLKGIAFVESRWTQITPTAERNRDDSRMPPAFGVMGLRDDNWFGHSLQNAASLLGVTASELEADPQTNIRAAAALLTFTAHRMKLAVNANDVSNWAPAVAAYSGIPQPEIAVDYALSVYNVLQSGWEDERIHIDAVDIDLVRISEILSKSLPAGMPQSVQSADYPPAVWDPSPNYGSRGATPITHVIVHDTEGSFAGAVSWLKNPVAQASAHYVIRSADGYMKQLVREADMAWHVRCWNSWTLGIEHEGYVNQPSYFTPQMYQASAALVRHFCSVHNIPKDRLHIVGHNVWQDPVIFGQLGWTSCNDHTDPGQYWNWNYYMALIVADSTRPVVLSHYPHDGGSTVPVYKTISVTFDRPMDIGSTQSAFSVSPVTAGAFTWSNDATVLTFKPARFLQSSTPYRVTISTAAHGAGGGALSQPFTLDFTTRAPDTTGPAVLTVFPTNGLSSVDPFMGFQIRFDETVIYSSFSGHISVTDDSSRSLGLTNIVYSDLDEGSLLTFTPKDSLKWGRSYTLSVTPGLKDPLGNLSTTTYSIQFSTLAVSPAQGYVIDGFENNDRGWLQPADADGSLGIDTAQSAFAISSTRKRAGYYSGMISYAFTDSVGGSCALSPAVEIPVQSSTGWLGLYLFGDNSRNRLDFLFSTTAGETTIAVDTVTWYGWGFVRMDLTTISRPITSLRGIVIRHIAGGEAGGVVYVDNLQSENPVIASVPWAAPASFQLYQNYPNPFNPTTTIYFELQRFDEATVEIFNPLGQRVTTVLDRALEPGRYKVEFDGSGLSSGVYFYRLRTGAGSQMRKMVLLR